jgi:phosphoribosylpyrophosphate synthetase
VRQIVVAVTHGLFTGTAWQQLRELDVDRIICTDSVGGVTAADRRVQVISCAPVLAAALRAFTEVSHAHG